MTDMIPVQMEATPMRSRLDRVQAFADAAQSVSSVRELEIIMSEAACDFGADFYLMIHHADFRRRTHGLVKVGNYPEEFISASRAGSELVGDAIMEACEKTLSGFFWDDVGRYVSVTKQHLMRRAAVERTGLGDGFVVPTHIPGEHLGSCHFAVGTGRQMPRDTSAALQAIAMFGFEAARRLVRDSEGPHIIHQPLTIRQRECLVLSARGKSDAVIAQLLGLSPKTVNNYIEEAKRRYNVATRGQLIASALYTSEITFQDIVDSRARKVFDVGGSSASGTN
jgi:LuxR family quorum-sensing system transcriptional regulator CciR